MAAAITALDIMEKDPSAFEKLKNNCLLMQELLDTNLPTDLLVHGHPESVVKHVRLTLPSGDKSRDQDLLHAIVMQVCKFKLISLILLLYLLFLYLPILIVKMGVLVVFSGL